MQRKLLLFFSVIVLLFVLFGCSKKIFINQSEETHREAILELVSMMNMDTLLSQTIDKILDIQIQQNPSLKDYKETMSIFFNKYMSWESLKEDYIKIYQEEFTEDEIRDLIDFYKTNTGKKTLVRLPVLMQKGAQIGQQRVKDNQQELEEMILKRQEELNNTSSE
jgi:hypothetical protein